jgi:putative phage-type endonuclease
MIEQGTPEWFAARLGKVTASRVADVIARTKTGPAASRANYMAQIVCERLTGEAAESFTSKEMQWGTDQEPNARSAYEFRTDTTVELVGFVPHPKIGDSGASPDGLVAADGLVEIKCPNTATHIETLLGRTVPGKYITQIQWQLACTGREWCDYVSFDPRMPESMSLFVARVERDPKMIADLEAEVFKFLDELAFKVAELELRYNRKAAA